MAELLIRKVREVEAEVVGVGDEIESVVGSHEDDEAERALVRVRTGLTYEKLCETISAGLGAETIVINKHTKKEIGRVPNHMVRAKFAPLAAEIIGAKKSDGAVAKFPAIIIMTSDGRRV
jgi:hypothetical protein